MSFDPITLMTIGTIAGVGGAAVSGLAAFQQAQYQAAVAERNRITMEQNAREAIVQSQREQADWGISAREQLGNLAAEIAASGVTGGSGNMRLQGAGLLARRDNQRINEEGVQQANNYYQAAADAEGAAAQARAAGRFSIFQTGASMLNSYIGGSLQTQRVKRLIS